MPYLLQVFVLGVFGSACLAFEHLMPEADSAVADDMKLTVTVGEATIP